MRDYIPIYWLGTNRVNNSYSFFAVMYKLPKYSYVILGFTCLKIDD